MPFCEQFCVGARDGVLKELISNYKYNSIRASCYVFAELLEAIVGATDCVLVPLPTIRRHIRERGFDHIDLICRKISLPMARVLKRAKDSVQVGSNNEQRRKQASEAYYADGIEAECRYLLVDDVWTTGSSMMAACEAMRAAGSKNLAIAVIARSV